MIFHEKVNPPEELALFSEFEWLIIADNRNGGHVVEATRLNRAVGSPTWLLWLYTALSLSVSGCPEEQK